MFFPFLLLMATGWVKFEDASTAAADNANENQEESADFREAAGKRYRRTKELLLDKDFRIRIAILASVMEPLRYLHAHF